MEELDENTRKFLEKLQIVFDFKNTEEILERLEPETVSALSELHEAAEGVDRLTEAQVVLMNEIGKLMSQAKKDVSKYASDLINNRLKLAIKATERGVQFEDVAPKSSEFGKFTIKGVEGRVKQKTLFPSSEDLGNSIKKTREKLKI
jgi:hypothetical protein